MKKILQKIADFVYWFITQIFITGAKLLGSVMEEE